jgi:hypothetical protein
MTKITLEGKEAADALRLSSQIFDIIDRRKMNNASVIAGVAAVLSYEIKDHPPEIVDAVMVMLTATVKDMILSGLEREAEEAVLQ